MKLNNEQKRILGISLVFSAVTLMFSFIILCFKKKSILSAVLALAAAEGVIGLALIKDDLPCCKKAEAEAEEDEEPVELFDDEELAYAESVIGAELSQRNDGEAPTCPNAKRVIPTDDEASEADFM